MSSTSVGGLWQPQGGVCLSSVCVCACVCSDYDEMAQGQADIKPTGKKRVLAIDTFRGISLTIMIFGEYPLQASNIESERERKTQRNGQSDPSNPPHPSPQCSELWWRWLLVAEPQLVERVCHHVDKESLLL